MGIKATGHSFIFSALFVFFLVHFQLHLVRSYGITHNRQIIIGYFFFSSLSIVCKIITIFSFVCFTRLILATCDLFEKIFIDFSFLMLVSFMNRFYILRKIILLFSMILVPAAVGIIFFFFILVE